MAGLGKVYIENNIVAQLVEVQRRLLALERGIPLQETIESSLWTVYEEISGDPYLVVLRIENGKARLYARPLTDTFGSTEMMIT